MGLGNNNTCAAIAIVKSLNFKVKVKKSILKSKSKKSILKK